MAKESKSMWMIYGNNIISQSSGTCTILEGIWQQANSEKIQGLLKTIGENPFNGIGQPEELKYKLSGFWSRRIKRKYRIVYDPHKNPIEVIS